MYNKPEKLAIRLFGLVMLFVMLLSGFLLVMLVLGGGLVMRYRCGGALIDV